MSLKGKELLVLSSHSEQGFALLSRMLRNAIKLEAWPRARPSCEL